MKLAEQDWAQAGRALYLCSGLACLALSLLSDPEVGAGRWLLRVWVGGFGVLVVAAALRRGR
jgi:D-arabinose 1-dehydrogenase-like Zn-dependent alcohol dehydrogenase